ncbi:MAG: histidinol dehydrogenase [Gammaproteobacteria bacterium]|jgi:histidinol dehydrogenase
MKPKFLIRRLHSSDAVFKEQLKSLLANTDEPTVEISRTVESILADVRTRGDEALLEYTNRFDDRDASIDDIEIPAVELEAAVAAIPDELRQGLEHAAARVRDYHERQITESWSYKDKEGNTLGQQVTPLDSVGIYVPGGKAAYPSSVIMNAIPAHVAGVSEIIMVVPTPKGEKNQLVLAAAAISGVSKVFSIGGAQAVAALAYGTVLVPKVDKIVGPGNIYVATAKRQVFGTVGIDMIAGPSEVLIVSDGESNPDWVAMDLFAQAEHDEEACAILICPKVEFLDAVEESINRLLPEMERKDIIKKSLDKNGALILVEDIDEAIDLVNQVAPEHLELSMTAPEAVLPRIRHAGAIFMGHYAAEALGDYCAGPNHVLPTARTARFSSPLGVYDFQKRSSVIMCTEQSASSLASTASVLARGEGLTAHARSAEYRIKS